MASRLLEMREKFRGGKDRTMNKRWNVNVESVLLAFCSPEERVAYSKMGLRERETLRRQQAAQGAIKRFTPTFEVKGRKISLSFRKRGDHAS
jgi:hypothetical protein